MNIAPVFFSMTIRLAPDLPKKTVLPGKFRCVGVDFSGRVFARHGPTERQVPLIHNL